MSYKFSLLAITLFFLSACEKAGPPAADLAAEAQRIARESIIVDTHIDVPYRVVESLEDVSKSTESGDFDYPRAKAGGLDAAFMSIYTPANLEAL
jgi:membrane dipeptidase